VSERIISLEARSEWERALDAVPHMFGHTWGSLHADSLQRAIAPSSTRSAWTAHERSVRSANHTHTIDLTHDRETLYRNLSTKPQALAAI